MKNVSRHNQIFTFHYVMAQAKVQVKDLIEILTINAIDEGD